MREKMEDLLCFLCLQTVIKFSMQYWLLKTEPSTYSWDDLVCDGKGSWDGVRNYQARNNLRAMKKGDLVFIYHSVHEKVVKGIAEVVREVYRDQTATEGDWSMVEIVPIQKLEKEISLLEIKQNPDLKEMILVNHSRLSVQPVSKKEWEICLNLSET